MRNQTEVSTACLDVTLQVNTAWMKQAPRQTARRAAKSEDNTMLLCSDIICVDEELRAQPDFDTTEYVLDQAITHTHRFCNTYGAKIRAFRSVEVLRLMQPGLPCSFLFLFEAFVVA